MPRGVLIDHEASVAIVGAGFAGLSVALRLHMLTRAPLRVHVIDPAPKPGSGIAYAPTDAPITMNGAAERLSAFDELPDHFVQWLVCRGYVESEDVAASFYAPRPVYGRYLEELAHTLRAAPSFGACVDFISDSVVDMDTCDGRYILRLTQGIVEADAVVLATGHGGVRPLEVASDVPVVGSWDWTALHRIGSTDRTLIVGTGHSMLDVVRTLDADGHRGEIHAVSRHGLLPQPHSLHEEEHFTLHAFPVQPTARSLMRFIRAEVARCVSGGGDWRQVLNALRPHTQSLWLALPVSERRRFLRHLLPYWDVHRTRTPQELAALVAALRGNRLTIHAARLLELRCSGRELQCLLRQRRTPTDVVLHVKHVVNCTGIDFDVARIPGHLINRLAARALVTRDPLGLGVCVDHVGAVIDKFGRHVPRLFAVGSLGRGSLFEIGVVREIRQQSHAVALLLLKKLGLPTLSVDECCGTDERAALDLEQPRSVSEIRPSAVSSGTSLLEREVGHGSPWCATRRHLTSDPDSKQLVRWCLRQRPEYAKRIDVEAETRGASNQ